MAARGADLRRRQTAALGSPSSSPAAELRRRKTAPGSVAAPLAEEEEEEDCAAEPGDERPLGEEDERERKVQDAVERWLEHEWAASPRERLDQQRAVLLDAMRWGGDAAAAELARRADLGALQDPDGDGATMLHHAAAGGLLECLRAILGREGLDPARLAATDRLGRTPLHRAAAVDPSGGACELLLRGGLCGAAARDGGGRSPLATAQEWGLPAAAAVLLAATAEAAEEARGQGGRAHDAGGRRDLSRPRHAHAGLDAVARGGAAEALGLLADRDWASNFANLADAAGRTMLHLAVLGDLEDVCRALLGSAFFRAADAVDRDMASALHLAVARRRLECCRIIVGSEKFTAVNARDLAGRSALHLAALRGDEEAYEAILAHPACCEGLPDASGRCAAEVAAERGFRCPVALPEALAGPIEM